MPTKVLKVVTPATDGMADRAEQEKNETDDEGQDPEYPKDLGTEQKTKNEQNYTDDDHCSSE